MKFVCGLLFICLFIWSFSLTEESSKEEKIVKTVKVIYVHGFGGKRYFPEFERDIKKTLYISNAEVDMYSWNSEGLSNSLYALVFQIASGKATHMWRRANERASSEESTEFLNQINRYEKKGISYYIVGYSLGAKIVVEALKKQKVRLKNVKGVFFLGAAIPNGTEFDRSILPSHLKITNYHSPKHDNVLKYLYKIVMFEKAGGSEGFTNTEIFENMETQSSHSPSTDKRCNFLNMANAIGYLISMEEGTLNQSDGVCSSPKPSGDRWNNIMKISEKLTIQQNSCINSTDHFRLVKSGYLFGNDTIGESCNLHSLLRK